MRYLKELLLGILVSLVFLLNQSAMAGAEPIKESSQQDCIYTKVPGYKGYSAECHPKKEPSSSLKNNEPQWIWSLASKSCFSPGLHPWQLKFERLADGAKEFPFCVEP
ncbi:MAG TPA: hypothetical protein VK203_06220 [Nostocaceae cyanobacterium]|nr:hypothetical protein [Nostocaceae cyanobacterium]